MSSPPNQQPTSMSDSEQSYFLSTHDQSAKTLKTAQECFSRCLTDLETGFKYYGVSKLHTRILQYLPISFRTTTHTIGIRFEENIFYIEINPDWFLALNTLETQIQVLLHTELHIFLMHPIREAHLSLPEGSLSLELFRACAEIEVLARLSASDFSLNSLQLNSENLDDLKSLNSISAESLYHDLKVDWQCFLQDKSNTQLSKYQLLKLLDYVNHAQSCCDRSHWSINGGPEKVRMFRTEFDRILLMARESLNLMELETLSKADQKRIKQVNQEYHLNQVSENLSEQTKLQKQAEVEVERVILQMQIRDSFFGNYLAACIRQVSTIIPTAGVAVRHDHIALVVNPHFFMNQLKDLAERAAVLKHEALHIMFKHIIMIRSDRFRNKILYNIAADLEVNQYISSPWSLPTDAVTLDQFSDLDLPRNEVAEVYYELLLKHHNELHCQNMIQQINHRKQPSSNHQAWDRVHQEAQREQGQSSSDLASPLTLPDELVKAQEYEIERQVKRIVDQTPSHQHGNIPGQILSLIEKWEQARRSPVNWKRELKLFMSLSRHARRTHTNRKPNKRHFIRQRLGLSTQQISSDAVHLLARHKPNVLPTIIWSELSKDLQEEAILLNSELETLSSNTPLPWLKLPRLVIHKLQRKRTDLAWPNWSDLDDAQLSRLKVLRTPLSTRHLPLELYLIIAQEVPKLLPRLNWNDLEKGWLDTLVSKFPYLSKLKEFSWSILPAQAMTELYQSRPELFNLSWSDVPPQLIAKTKLYHFTGQEAFRIDRIISKTQPGTKRRFQRNTILVVIDTSGSVSEQDIKDLFDHIDGIKSQGSDVHILQVDTEVQLYYRYTGQTRPVAGRGGTRFNPAFEWIRQARSGGVLTSTYTDQKQKQRTQKHISLNVDGVVYLTDGHASTPTVNPQCRVLWALTSRGSSDHTLKDWAHTTKIMVLPELIAS